MREDDPDKDARLPIVGMDYTIPGEVREAEVYVVGEKLISAKVKYCICDGLCIGSERHVGRTKLAHSVPSAVSHHHSAAPICVVQLSFSPLTNTNGQPILLLRVLLYVLLFLFPSLTPLILAYLSLSCPSPIPQLSIL